MNKEAQRIFKKIDYFRQLIDSYESSELAKWIAAQEPYFYLLNRDLKLLIYHGTSLPRLKEVYKERFIKCNNVLETIYEIHFGAVLTKGFTNLHFKVPKSEQSNKDFDFQATYKNTSINFEIKTRIDLFPFHGEHNGPIYHDSHETVDKKYINQVNKGDPESSVLRDIFQSAKQQLPNNGLNLIVLGQIFAHSDKTALWALKNAIFGDLVHRTYRKNPKKLNPYRYKNGIFYSKSFSHIAGVIWFRIIPNIKSQKEKIRIFFNKNYKYILDTNFKSNLEKIFNKGRIN